MWRRWRFKYEQRTKIGWARRAMLMENAEMRKCGNGGSCGKSGRGRRADLSAKFGADVSGNRHAQSPPPSPSPRAIKDIVNRETRRDETSVGFRCRLDGVACPAGLRCPAIPQSSFHDGHPIPLLAPQPSFTYHYHRHVLVLNSLYRTYLPYVIHTSII